MTKIWFVIVLYVDSFADLYVIKNLNLIYIYLKPQNLKGCKVDNNARYRGVATGNCVMCIML